MKDEEIFYTKMEQLIPLIDGNKRKSEFVKAFCNKEMGIEDIENSMVSFKGMNSKVFYFLLLSLLIDYCNEHETNERYIQNMFGSGYSTSGLGGAN